MAEITGALDAAPPSAETGLPTSSAPSLVPVADTAIALKKERSRVAGRRILIGGLIVIGGLFSILALRTALFAPPQSPAPPKAPPAASGMNPPEGASVPAQTTNPAATKFIETGPASGAAGPEPSPREGVPTEIKEAPSETNPAPSAAAPVTPQEQGLAAPEGQQQPPSAPSGIEGGSKPEAPPAETEGKLDAAPRAIGPIKSHETTEPQKDENAAEAKRPTAGKKAKAIKAKSPAGRRPSAGTDPFSSFLTRTTNSVRKFFGRLGQNGGRASK
ncbi:hypothetical protein V3H18_09745 [Methylocystis sp. 9N]|uniref:Translation initiation factor IF-2 n=1 Tax=Methylocystis borbori TaxID=3118750 RepID=A0ABU7XHY6_9HYPH